MTEFFSGIWSDPTLHIHLLDAMEKFPPYGSARETQLANITHYMNKCGFKVSFYRSKVCSANVSRHRLTRTEIEERINKIVPTTHPVRLHCAHLRF